MFCIPHACENIFHRHGVTRDVRTMYKYVRTVFVLNSNKLIFTSGYDSILSMWDMGEGLAISFSRPLGCTIRAVAVN